MNWPSLKDEVKSFLNEYEIVDVKKFTKLGWKNFISDKIIQKNRFSLLEMAKSLKKVDYLNVSVDEFKIKDYFLELRLDLARMKYREVSKCVKTCRSHAPSDPDSMRALYQCFHCNSQDTLGHWWVCESYKHLTINKSKDSDKDICEFYQAVIQLRSQQTQ